MSDDRIPYSHPAPRQTTTGPYVDAAVTLARLLAPTSAPDRPFEMPDLHAAGVTFEQHGLTYTLGVQRTPWPVPEQMNETRTVLRSGTEQVVVHGPDHVQVILRRLSQLTITVTALLDQPEATHPGTELPLTVATMYDSDLLDDVVPSA